MGRFTDLLLARRDTVPTPTPMVGFPSYGGVLPGGVTGTTALGISAVWRCLDILANGVSQLDWQERRGNLPLPSSRIVRRPQSQRTRREWVSIVVSTLALYDVCYLLKAGGVDAEGVPISLVYLQPGIVSPKAYDQFGIFPPTEYYVNGVEIDADRLVVLHRSPQPGVFDGVGGVISVARATFAAAIAAENYASRYWQAGGSSSLYLRTDANMPNTTAIEIGDRWSEKRRLGPDHIPVLTGGLKAEDTGIDPMTASAVEARRDLVGDVGRYFGIGSSILNSPNQSSETYSTTEVEGLHLVTFTLQNYIDAIQDAITDQLPGGRQLFIDPARLYRSTFLNQAQALQLMTGNKAVMDVDEARDLLGLPPVENPDQLNPPAPVPVIAAGPPAGGNQNGG